LRARTRYAKSGGANIAYQVVGGGDLDLVFVPGWVSHIEQHWEEPHFAAFLERLASFSRLILLDRVGTGLSDPAPQLRTLEERADEVRAVMDAAGSSRAALLGVSEGGPMSAYFAATWPERTGALVLLNSYAALRRSDEISWGASDQEIEENTRAIEEVWGSGRSAEVFAPSLARDREFVEAWSRIERYGASPGTAQRLIPMAAKLDVRGTLSSIRVPTLVLHRKGDRVIRVDHAHFLASRIHGAKLVLLDGDDHLPYVGDADPIHAELERFLTGKLRSAAPDRVLATVLFTDIADSTRRIAELGDRAWRDLLARFYAVVRSEVERFRGRELDTAGDGFLAAFDGPARAIRCAQALREGVEGLGLRLRQGLHTGECELLGDKLSGMAVHIGARVAAEAAAGEILVSGTVKDLVVGSDLAFEDRATRVLKGVPGEWRLFAAA
jgi:pimeloyl-ACP methyl ester carboxylesterase